MKNTNVIFILLLVFICSGCVRKDLYLRGMVRENCAITTTIDITLDILTTIQADINSNLIYNWDETLYGPLGYTVPTHMEGKFFQYRGVDNRVWDHDDLFEIGIPKDARILTDTRYEVLFNNLTNRTNYNTDDKYSQYISSPDYKPTKAFDFVEDFGVSAQCEEQFAAYKENVYVDVQDPAVEVTTMPDGSLLYHYNMDVKVVPISYIYIIQVIIDNDNPRAPMNVDSCTYMALNGVAREKEMFTNMTTDKRCCIESHYVKPIQKSDSCYVFAERFVTYGMINDYYSSWGTAGLTYELGMEFLLSDGTTKKGKVNLGGLLNSKPYGGVLTIRINNSDINTEYSGGGGFDVTVQDWVNEVNVVVEI